MATKKQNVKRPFAMRQWVATPEFHTSLDKILADAAAGSINKFNLELRIKDAKCVLRERDELLCYARDLERRLRAASRR